MVLASRLANYQPQVISFDKQVLNAGEAKYLAAKDKQWTLISTRAILPMTLNHLGPSKTPRQSAHDLIHCL